MTRKITIKGIGQVQAKADYVEISMKITSKSIIYKDALENAQKKNQYLLDSLCSVGFDKEDLKTTDFDISLDYKSVEDSKGNYVSMFNAYEVIHRLKLSFDFEQERLSKAIEVISNSLAKPKIDIHFTVKDDSYVSEELLRSAATNAKRNAEILCDSLGVTLGDLIDINYNWGEINIYSQTNYEYDLMESDRPRSQHAYMEIQPEDINVRDTVSFIWEIK